MATFLVVPSHSANEEGFLGPGNVSSFSSTANLIASEDPGCDGGPFDVAKLYIIGMGSRSLIGSA